MLQVNLVKLDHYYRMEEKIIQKIMKLIYIIYQLIYNVSIDDDMNINVDSYDGCYISDYWIPQIELL